MSDFVIQEMPNMDKNVMYRFMVRQNSTGWFYPNLSKRMAEELCDKLNEPMEKGQERFYIDDEYVKDKEGLMKQVWCDTYGNAIELRDFLNENIKGDCNCCKKY